jgi:hypothetical protein
MIRSNTAWKRSERKKYNKDKTYSRDIYDTCISANLPPSVNQINVYFYRRAFENHPKKVWMYYCIVANQQH